jgi:hypothetical protein
MLDVVGFHAEQYGGTIADILEHAGSGVRPVPLVRTASGSSELRNAINELRTSEAVRSGLYLYCGYWDEAHSAADSVENPDAYFWHGIVHRQEPDPGNSAYWFRRTGVHPVFTRLCAEAAGCGYKIETAVSARAWDPFAFIEYCESARRRPGSKEEQVAMKVQLIEWQLLFDYCARSSRG